jgi:hypothetical protein
MGFALKKPVFVVAPAALSIFMLGALWFIGRSANPGPIGFRLDDAWIHLVYGRGLLESGHLAYNDGVPSTGCTSPLWAICLATLHAAFGRSVDSLVRAIVLAGALVHVVGVVVGASLVARVTGSRLAGASAGGLIALATPWAAAAFSGMEITLTGLLLLLAMRSVVGRAWGRAGVWLALAGLARPEAGAVAVLAAGVAAIAGGRSATIRLLSPPIIAAGALGGHHLWASGSPLPAPFHAKSTTSLAAFPGRLATALTEMLPRVPPFTAGLGWLAAGGLIRRGGGADALFRALPFLAGLAFLAANLLVLDPADPRAFYHLRYVLPSVPLLLCGLAIGAHGLGERFASRAARAPAATLVLLSLIGAATTVAPVSRHYHNDVRNINEVQRRVGEWLEAKVPAGRWIAASDAGAIRYFSRLPTIDVVGLNTPEMLDPDEAFVRTHPVEAIALMPAWFRALDDEIVGVFRAQTSGYTVTSNPAMATQLVARARSGKEGDSPTVRIRFVGFRSFELDFLRPTLPPPPDDAP